MSSELSAQPTQQTRALEPSYYTDEASFKLEKERIFYKSWVHAGHISQLEKLGDFFSFSICDQNLFAIRDRDGTIRAFYNVCAHRAHQVVKGSGNKRVLVCPYHAWTYELNGRLKRYPNQENTDIDVSKISLSEVKIEDFCGFLFVNLDPKAKPMDWWFPNVREQLRAYVPDIDRLKPMQFVDVEENCNWKVSVENYNECYHCVLNHPTFAKGVIEPTTYDVQPYGYSLRHTTVSANLDAMSYPIDADANEHATDYSSWFLWPTLSFQVYPGNVLNTYHWTPTAVDKVIAGRGWHTVDGEWSDVIAKLAEQDRQTTVEEDIHLVESVQRGLNSRGYTNPGPLVLDPNMGVRSEHSIKALHDWTREAMTGLGE
ncbi:MAG: phenylpropionate dioxygenase-like ring-hydroxylating dioxygenase large terminal subunit [Gammaproteobacteria bacterium]|jgi:phenylpropionate dioxygenase-like ring-hydroxylating dioxygenase large terminal subunit